MTASSTVPASTVPASTVPWRAVVLSLLALAWLAGTTGSLRAGQLGVLAVVAVTGTVVVVSRDPRRRGVAATAGTLTLLAGIPVSRLPGDRSLLLLVLVGVLGLGGAAVVGASRRHLPRGALLVLLLVGGLAVATALGGHPGGLVALGLVAASFVPVLLVVGSLDGPGRRQVVDVLVALALGEAVLAVVEPFVFPEHLWAPAQLGSAGQVVPLTNELLGSLERSQGTLGHPLPLGMMLVVALALSVRYHSRAPVAARAAVQGLLLLGIVVAGARSSLLMAVVVVLLLSGRSLTPARLVAAMSAAVAAVAALVATSPDVSVRVGEIAESGSWQHRLGAVRSLGRLLLWQDLPDVLLGNGYGSTSTVASEGLLQNDGFAAVDNQFVLLLSQGGLLALGLLLALLALAVGRGERATRPAVLCVAGTMMVFDVLLWPGASVVLGIVLGLALASKTAPARTEPPPALADVRAAGAPTATDAPAAVVVGQGPAT